MWTDKIRLALLALSVSALTACAAGGGMAGVPTTTNTSTTATAGSVSGTGVVQSIDLVTREQAGLGLGTAAGAVVGGVLGNQVGSGSGRTAATVAGAAGGALIGHQMEKNVRAADRVYRVTIRMDDGSLQTLTQETQPQVQAGERVRLANGVIVERFPR
ncbi:MAG TPA: glycine zipper 2TM domain-containing protein [Noviherbaspirillum sp.]